MSTFKPFLSALILALLLFCTSATSSVYGASTPDVADSEPCVTLTSGSYSKACTLADMVNDNVAQNFNFKCMRVKKVTSTASGVSSGTVVYFNMSAVNKNMTYDDKETLVEYILASMTKCGFSTIDYQRTNSFLSDLMPDATKLANTLSGNTSLDFTWAAEVLRFSNSALGKFLGVLTLLMFVLLSLSTLLDLGYMSVSLIHVTLTFLSSKKRSGGRPWLVSREAYLAYKDAEASESDLNDKRSVLSLYMKTKLWQWVLLSVSLLYIIGGKLFVLVARLIGYFSGI